ncbi:hypothetical protein IKZ40_04600, partial [bacterium]|nr:hypothetical protein [bacterium]
GIVYQNIFPKVNTPSARPPREPREMISTSLSEKRRAKLFSLSLSRFSRQVATIILKTFPKVNTP